MRSLFRDEPLFAFVLAYATFFGIVGCAALCFVCYCELSKH